MSSSPLKRNVRTGWPCRLSAQPTPFRLGMTILFWSFVGGGIASAQITRVPSGAGVPLNSGMVPSSNSPVDIPQTNLVPIGPSAYSPPPASATLGNPLFDPYSGGTSSGTFQPALPPGTLPPPPASPMISGNGGLLGGIFSQPAASNGATPYTAYPAPSINSPSFGPPGLAQPTYGNPPGATPWQGTPYGSPPGFATPSYPSSIFPSGSPNTLFPGGLFGGGYGSGGYGAAGPSAFSAFRLLQGPRLRHTFINAGDAPADLQINTTDVSIAFAFPNFLYSSQPVYVVPSFSLHLWDGPNSSTGADLPGQAYDGFVDVGWQSDPNQMLGIELGLRVGAFTDFDTFNSDSIRVMGKGLLSFRLTPTSTLKGGVYYLDRNDIKVLPAGGLLYQPNPYTRLDLFFPEPKFARYWRTLGVYDVWGYLGGEFGGGSWTITRADNTEDSIDMNDFRVFAGLEWGQSDAIRAGRRTAFVELGYVFEREVEYKRSPLDDFKPEDAFFVRAGIGY